jgi:DNA-binding SARP family transcriptional activator/tetratricopeptide (TPR) repeat protein
LIVAVAGQQFTPETLGAIADPGTLLEVAWELEPWSRYSEREAVLDRLEQLLIAGPVPPPPAGRDWPLELAAERAIDLGRSRRLEEAQELIGRVLREAEPAHTIALARAQLAHGQALAWIGTDESVRRANRAFADAADRFAALGDTALAAQAREWQGSALLRRGYSACYQYGDLPGAEALIAQALAVWDPDSQRLPSAVVSYADVLIDLGEFERAEQELSRATALAERLGVEKAFAEATWGRSRIAAARGDARATERLLREAQRESAHEDWFQTHIGTSFLLEATELLDRVGLTDEAAAYFEQARARAGDEDEEVMQARAVLLARSGEPWLALEQLQALARGDWLEKRTSWRHTLLTAWATFRAGRDGAGAIAARSLAHAAACGSVRIAQAGEPELTAALAPLAEAAGSPHARGLLADGRPRLVRLFGTPTVVCADGTAIELPAGKPGELVRMLALRDHGFPVDAVLEVFFPDAPPSAGRQRLRQVLTRLRAGAGELVIRDGDTLRLIDAWVDVREFIAISNQARGARGARAAQLAYAALALRSGPLLPTDPYAAWAETTRNQVEHRYLELLDLVAADAAARGSHQEALTALEAAVAEDPDDLTRRNAMAEHLAALRRQRTAEQLVGVRGQPRR